jgi:universal stress protein A
VSVTYDHIACFIDDSDAASRALSHAAALRDATGARLSVVHVLAPPAFLVSLAAGLGGAPVHDTELEREAAEMWLAEEARSVEAEAIMLEGHPANTASEWAREAGVDIMVAARHGGGAERALLGSFASHLAHHAPCSVFLVPPEQGAS